MAGLKRITGLRALVYLLLCALSALLLLLAWKNDHLDAANAAIRVDLGNLYFDAERFDMAISWYEAALKIDPKNVIDYAGVSKLVAQGPAKGGYTLIDSRPKERKFDKGHIPGAINIPDSDFDKLLDRLPADKASPLYFYCEGLSCKLSSDSAEKAVKLGYTQVKVVPEGYPGWVKLYGAGPTGGAAVAHQIINTGGTTMRYLSLSNIGDVEICEYPDSNKIGVHADEPETAGLHKLFRSEATVDYYDRETNERPTGDAYPLA